MPSPLTAETHHALRLFGSEPGRLGAHAVTLEVVVAAQEPDFTEYFFRRQHACYSRFRSEAAATPHQTRNTWKGVILIVAGIYHLIYLVVSKDGRKLVIDFLPVKKDLADIVGTVRWLVGLRKEKPQIGRFGYAEKMEYWAVIWGTIIMGATGLMVWFKMEVTQWLPRWAVDVALTIHYYEAILACLAIIIWHFYHVMFDPDVYPLNLACVDGKVSEHWQQEEHPLDAIVPETNTPTQSSHDQPRSTE